MGILKKVWSKTRFAREAEAKKEQKKFEDEIRAEIKDEIKKEVKEALKEKIKKEEIDKALGVEKPKEKKGFLDMLSKEFAGTNVGGTDKLNQMLGNKSNTQNNMSNSGMSNEKIMSAFGNRNVNLPNDKGYNFNRNTEDLLGMKKSTTGKGLNTVELMGHKTSQTGKQVDMNKLIGLKKKQEDKNDTYY